MQLALLTATVKLFIKRPTAGQHLVPKVLKWATEHTDNPDLRDRGYIYWRLLSTDPAAAASIVLSEKPQLMPNEAEMMDRGVLDRLLLHAGTLASIYAKEPQDFIRGSRPRFLQSRESSSAPPSSSSQQQSSINPPPPPMRLKDASSSSISSIQPPPIKRRANEGASGSGVGVGLNAAGGRNLLTEEDDEDERGAEGLLGAGTVGEADDDAEEEERRRRVQLDEEDEEDELDPYASLARMSFDGGQFGRLEEEEYDTRGGGQRSRRPVDDGLL